MLMAGCVTGLGGQGDHSSGIELRRGGMSHSKGRVTRSGTRKYQTANDYDLVGRVVKSVHTIEGVSYRYSFQYGYTGGGANSGEFGPRVIATEFPDGERLTVAVDSVGDSQQVLSSFEDATLGQMYRDEISGRKKLNSFGQLDWQDLGNGTRTYAIYDSSRRLSQSVTMRLRDGTVLQAFEYRYDKTGRITAVDDFCTWETSTPVCCDPREASCNKQEQSVEYEYDVAGWLKTAKWGGVIQSFFGDAIGNLTRKADSHLEYADANHPHAVTKLTTQTGSVSGTYRYNEIGSLIRMEEDGVVTQFKWNAANMPVETHRGSDVTKRFYVDETLYKREDTINGEVATTWFLPGVRIENDTFRKNYGVAERESQPSRNTPEGRRGTLRFFHTNHLGSSTLVTNAEGVPVHRAVYAPYGEELRKVGAYTPKQAFTGKERETVTGLYDYGARLYNSRTGRFISADSVMDGLNRYSYVANDPINYNDPTGHEKSTIELNSSEYFYDESTREYRHKSEAKGKGGNCSLVVQVTDTIPMTEQLDFLGYAYYDVRSTPSPVAVPKVVPEPAPEIVNTSFVAGIRRVPLWLTFSAVLGFVLANPLEVGPENLDEYRKEKCRERRDIEVPSETRIEAREKAIRLSLQYIHRKLSKHVPRHERQSKSRLSASSRCDERPASAYEVEVYVMIDGFPVVLAVEHPNGHVFPKDDGSLKIIPPHFHMRRDYQDKRTAEFEQIHFTYPLAQPSTERRR